MSESLALRRAGGAPDAVERALRIELAACYRLVAHYGLDDIVYTHISARIPGPEHHFLINAFGTRFAEITASSLVKIDLDGNKVIAPAGARINEAGFVIHSALQCPPSSQMTAERS